MSKFGGGADDGSAAIIAEQRRQAEEQERRERELQARRANTVERINAIFNGGSHTTLGDPGTPGGQYGLPDHLAFVGGELPTGTELINNNGTWGYNVYSSGGGTIEDPGGYIPGYPTGPQIVGFTPVQFGGDSGPRIVDAVAATPGVTTEYAGLGDTFFNNYKNSMLEYYMPQLQDQFGDASEQQFFNFARRGTARSSAYADAISDLEEDRLNQEADIRLNADTQTADLRNRKNQERQAAIELANISEDPSVAANRALTEVNAVSNASPNLSPLGDLFNIGALAQQGYNEAQRRSTYLSSVPTSNPYTRRGRVVT